MGWGNRTQTKFKWINHWEEKRGKRRQSGSEERPGRQAHWDKPGMTEMPIAPKDVSNW